MNSPKDGDDKSTPKTFSPLGLSRADWDAFKRDHLRTADQRDAMREAWRQYEEARRKRWEDAGFVIDWRHEDR